jgi:hypothetical protein
MALIAVLLREPKREQARQQGHGFDVIGFVKNAVTAASRTKSVRYLAIARIEIGSKN